MSATAMSQPIKKKYKTLIQLEREKEAQVAAAAAASSVAVGEQVTTSTSVLQEPIASVDNCVKSDDNDASESKPVKEEVDEGKKAPKTDDVKVAAVKTSKKTASNANKVTAEPSDVKVCCLDAQA
jgi:hypothetical protein